jgi:hypothetical protein
LEHRNVTCVTTAVPTTGRYAEFGHVRDIFTLNLNDNA